MRQRGWLPYLLLAGLALAVGFLALAIAISIEPQYPSLLIAVFSPGLKLAELLTPETGQSFAWTAGWFLRLAILANAVFYFVIFFFIAYPMGHRRSN
jgi:hypothetical protein